MKRTKPWVAAGLAVSLLTSWTGYAVADQTSHPEATANGTWVELGKLQAAKEADHDRLTITGNHDNFHALKFRVTDAPLNVQRIVVTYDSGNAEELQVREQIPQGGETRVIDLNGGKRSLRAIDFWYDTQGNHHGKADVTVLARR